MNLAHRQEGTGLFILFVHTQSCLIFELLKTHVSCTARAVQNGSSDSQTGKEQLQNVWVFFSNLCSAAFPQIPVFRVTPVPKSSCKW